MPDNFRALYALASNGDIHHPEAVSTEAASAAISCAAQ
jgi:hypothetical protein